MFLNWINVSIYADNWGKVLMLLPQAERAINDVIERETVANNTNSKVGGGTSSKNYKELILGAKAKLATLNGLLKLQAREYKAAAEQFLKVI